MKEVKKINGFPGLGTPGIDGSNGKKGVSTFYVDYYITPNSILNDEEYNNSYLIDKNFNKFFISNYISIPEKNNSSNFNNTSFKRYNEEIIYSDKNVLLTNKKYNKNIKNLLTIFDNEYKNEYINFLSFNKNKKEILLSKKENDYFHIKTKDNSFIFINAPLYEKNKNKELLKEIRNDDTIKIVKLKKNNDNIEINGIINKKITNINSLQVSIIINTKYTKDNKEYFLSEERVVKNFNEEYNKDLSYYINSQKTFPKNNDYQIKVYYKINYIDDKDKSSHTDIVELKY